MTSTTSITAETATTYIQKKKKTNYKAYGKINHNAKSYNGYTADTNISLIIIIVVDVLVAYVLVIHKMEGKANKY
ncbi:Hypothetical predicted protein [Octopus vulgaris]|uniref:Uncharacterized protein n=1 Tax=Octopus vulgaris TaxID=6645 RepID=A0AA36BFU6_OCTVU|nr:Hypothetical predicted protein [Octopus vulgaris]